MRLVNGLFAFATISFMTGLVVEPDGFLANRSCLLWIELLLYWHVLWYVFAKPITIFFYRFITMFWLTCFLAFVLGHSIPPLVGSIPPLVGSTQGIHVSSFLVEGLRLLAICDIVFCMQMITSSLPPSLRLKARKASSPANTAEIVSLIAQAPAD
jgi:hypothetical protein